MRKVMTVLSWIQTKGQSRVQIRTEEGLLVWCSYILAPSVGTCTKGSLVALIMVKTRSARGGNLSQPLGRGQVPSNLPPHPPPPIPNTFPPVDHAEGEDENQPHNSLVLAQLLAWNNLGDPLINLLNPAPQPPAPPQNPEPVQHAPAVSESQGQSHVAPAQQPPHDDVTRRLDSLEKLVVEQRGIPPPHPAADSVPHPLNTNIILESYPAGFRIPQLETYDGTKDPDDHLHAFYSCMQAQNTSDALMCKIFPSTLRGNARTWYYSLPPRSINSYTEMASAFATKFSSRRLIRKTTSELMRVKQRDGESLKNFMSRFNDAVLEVNYFDQAVGITAVISGLSHERFRDSLLKHPTNTFSEVNDRSLKFITAKEYALSQNLTPIKNQHPDWRDENPNRKRIKTTQNRGPMSASTLRFGRPNSVPPQQPAGKPPVNWTPFNLPRSQIFMQIKNKMDLRCPGPMRTAAATRDHARYCDFHQDHDHTTEQCNSLRSELESLAQKGMLNEYIQRVEQPRFVREQGPQHQGVRNSPNRQGVGYQQAPPPLPPPARVIHMITGGLEAGGLSSKQRKLYVRERYDGPIYGFNNQPVPVEGVLTMNVAFGSGRSYVTPSVRFLVVKMASSFNTVIGRPTLTEIRAVVSQSHLCMKFPTPTGIATLRGNQEVARHCYIISVTQPQKGKAQTPEINPKQVPDDRQVMGVEIIDNRPEDETRAAPVEDVEEVQIDDRDPSRKTQIGTKLNPEERAELIAFLRANRDVFAWTSADMPGIPTSVFQHKLSTNPLKKPVAQKQRLFEGERLKVIKEEVEKLLQAGFIRRVDYCEWVTNSVLVKKANGKWRMCIDYTNLNDACPKDCYPMPNIDKLVEAASGNERLSLLDAYSGYHQVPMAPEDEEKTSFYAGDEIYCYVMMPFDVKNAGATYQKMVTIVFQAQIGRNLEVYVDDIVSGKFLGFMVSRRGIEVNPEKIRAIAEMELPKSVKDIQRLTGRVAALHRFISKSADKFGHYSGKKWNETKADRCLGQTEPVLGTTYPGGIPPGLAVQKTSIEAVTDLVKFFDTTNLSLFRKDGHPSKFNDKGAAGEGVDCIHWCVPGVPDTWNEILYNLIVA
ncbi:hypothetical protein SLEP1_g52418 [Rubroshorea leprosula]|uniref:Retrotransposon gag domain-containing protein n=1 Tax=Rubroshorea leprosula TaxID=152421 RepID=A0AAV5M732_9ROSI|nr:hypothetical protein SLEP1_g52418 [Rubroshorea leprosula]